MKKRLLQSLKSSLSRDNQVENMENIKGGLRVFSTHNYQEYVNYYYTEVCDKGFGHGAMQGYSNAAGYTVCYDW